MDHFELRDVPRDRWLYADRSMAKWLGWLLSDHTAYLSEKKKSGTPTPLLPQMRAADIDENLQTAWQKSKPITLQLTPDFDEDEHAPMISGAIVGFSAGQISIMQRETGELATISVAEIRHAELVAPKHWWAA
jgi:hypothetical protein